MFLISVPSVNLCVSRGRWTNPFRVGLLASNNISITFTWHLSSQVIYKILVSIRVKILIAKYLNSVPIPFWTRHFPVGSVVFSKERCQKCEFYHFWMNDVLKLTHFNYLVKFFLNTLLILFIHLFKRQFHYGVYVPRDNYNKYCYHNNNSPYYHFLNTPNFANKYTDKDVQKITSNPMLFMNETIILFSTFYILF